jgi:hypothetical protein
LRCPAGTPAFENADITALMQLFRDGAASGTPSPTWFPGRERITPFLRSPALGEPGDFWVIPPLPTASPRPRLPAGDE